MNGYVVWRKKIIACLLVAGFVTSLVFYSSTATPKSSELNEDNIVESIVVNHNHGISDDQHSNGTRINWDIEHNSSSDQSTWENRNWLFGPTPSYEVYHENGTLITNNHYAQINESLKLSVIIPTTLFSTHSDLGEVMLYGDFQSPFSDFSASYLMGFKANHSEPWWSYSAQNNASAQQGSPTPSFIVLNVHACTHWNNASAYYIDFSVRFTSNTTLGLYSLELLIYDVDGTSIGTFSFMSGWEFRGFAVGMTPTEAWRQSLSGTYTLQKSDIEGNDIYSVNRGQDFIMKYEVSGLSPDIVQLTLMVPPWAGAWLNQTEYHSELATDTGGWMYNETTGLYYFNATTSVTYSKWVYCTFEKYIDWETGNSMMVDINHLEWNATSQTWEVYTQEELMYQRLIFLYNGTSESFETYFGYTAHGAYPYDEYVPGVREQPVTEYFPVPDDVPMYFELNASLCSKTTSMGNEIYTFGGHFTEFMSKSTPESGLVWFEDVVIGPDQNPYCADAYSTGLRQTEAEYMAARQVAIESPVVIAQVLTESGNEPHGWFFATDKNEKFMVKARMVGGGSSLEDVSAISFDIHTHDMSWSESERRWSSIIYDIQMDMDGTPKYSAFNWTAKENCTYGTYMDWVLVNTTGWHYEYNLSTSAWDWVYGEYPDWQWLEVEDFHWQYWYFNQLTQEWQKNWITPKSAESGISVNFASTSGFTSWIDSGDLCVSFLVNLTDEVPDSIYFWNVAFMTEGWYIDYASGYQTHNSLYTWNNEWVYSFEYNSQDVYMEPFNDNQLAYYNNTLCGLASVEYLIGKEVPNIVIDGCNLPLEVTETYNPWSGMTSSSFFSYNPWDPEAESDYYYTLTNGTRIYINKTDVLYIYNVTLGNGDWFLAGSECSMSWYHEGSRYYSFMDIYGAIHQGTDADIYENVSATIHDEVDPPDERHFYVRYGLNKTLNLTSYWQWDSRENLYYMVDTDYNLYWLEYNETDYQYYAFIEGSQQKVSWPLAYYTLDYMGSEIILSRAELRSSWHYEHEGVSHEMPYPGANAEDEWAMSTTVTNGGKVPSTLFLTYLGNDYEVYNVSTNWFVDIESNTYSVEENHLLYSRANDTEIWDPTTIYYSADIGSYNGDLQFSAEENVFIDSSYVQHDFVEDVDYYALINGTTWVVNVTTYVFSIFKYELDGEVFYSEYPGPTLIENGTHSWYAYPTINGTLMNLTVSLPLSVIETYPGHAFENSTGRFYEFQSVEYEYMRISDHRVVTSVFNATMPGDLFIGNIKPVYQFDYHSALINATAKSENIRHLYYWSGYAAVYGPTAIDATAYKNFMEIVVGTPDTGMWGVRKWTVNDDNGALDLDGDLDTTGDQYFVLQEYHSTGLWNHTWDTMNVQIWWEPNGTLNGDEILVNSYLGLDEFTWTYEWNQTYSWYHSNDMSPVTPAEMQTINNTLYFSIDRARAGYWDIAWMAINVTWQDILDEAAKQGWDWISSNEQTWNWLSFGVLQDYGTSYQEGDVDHWLGVGMHYEYSGLMIWEDRNNNSQMDVDLVNPGSGELTHYLIPRQVASVDFIQPGLSFGCTNETGFMWVNLTDEVTWGVIFHEVNGTVYPFTLGGYFGWYDGLMTGSDMDSFDERPSDVSIDEISFIVHFQGHMNTTSLNNYAEMKVDNYVGNFDVDMVGGQRNLENRSLALNYMSDVEMTDFAVKANGTFQDNDKTVSSDTFDFETAGARFAKMIMGGVSYDWSKNTSARINVTSYTTPLGTFRAAYESNSGQSATSWSFTKSMFYLTIGFPEWDGYSVYQDPVFVAYISISGRAPGEVQFGPLSINPQVPLANEAVTVSVDIYSTETIQSAELFYSNDQSTWNSVDMTEQSAHYYVGTIPGFPLDTQVWYYVVAHIESGDTQSNILSYIVGQGAMTSTTTTLPYDDGIGTIVVAIGIGVAVVVILMVIITKRRKGA